MTKILMDFNYNVITNAQSEVMDEYWEKEIDANSEIKNVKWFAKGSLIQIDYYLDITENQILILQEYSNLGVRIFKNKIISGVYRKYDIEEFEESGVLVNKYVHVYDVNFDRPIYDCLIDIASGSNHIIEKWYRDTVNDFEYEFLYNAVTGDFISADVYDLKDKIDTTEFNLNPGQIASGINEFNFSWTGHEYYQNAIPIVPDGTFPA